MSPQKSNDWGKTKPTNKHPLSCLTFNELQVVCNCNELFESHDGSAVKRHKCRPEVKKHWE